MINTTTGRKRRHKRVRAKISGTKQRPRLAVFFSNRHVIAQLIDDESAHTLLASSDLSIKQAQRKSMTEKAKLVGNDIAKKAKAKKITSIIFDRGGFSYSSRIRTLADTVRKGGLAF